MWCHYCFMYQHLNFTIFALDTSSDVTGVRSSQPQYVPSSYSHSQKILLYSRSFLFKPFLSQKFLATHSHICGLAICIIEFHPGFIFLFRKNFRRMNCSCICLQQIRNTLCFRFSQEIFLLFTLSTVN